MERCPELRRTKPDTESGGGGGRAEERRVEGSLPARPPLLRARALLPPLSVSGFVLLSSGQRSIEIPY